MTAGTMMSEEERAKLLDYSFMLLDPEQEGNIDRIWQCLISD